MYSLTTTVTRLWIDCAEWNGQDAPRARSCRRRTENDCQLLYESRLPHRRVMLSRATCWITTHSSPPPPSPILWFIRSTFVLSFMTSSSTVVSPPHPPAAVHSCRSPNNTIQCFISRRSTGRWPLFLPLTRERNSAADWLIWSFNIGTTGILDLAGVHDGECYDRKRVHAHCDDRSHSRPAHIYTLTHTQARGDTHTRTHAHTRTVHS